MTDQKIISLIENILEEKMLQNENFIRYSYYELNIKHECLSEDDRKRFLDLLKIKLENCNYNVYLQGERFKYNNNTVTVQDNELLIAIKK